MYRNIHYDIDEYGAGTVDLFTWNEEGERVHLTLPQESSLYYEDKKGKHKSIFNTPLVRKSFQNQKSRRAFIGKNPSLNYFGIQPGAREFLQDMFHEVNHKADFSVHDMKVQFIDIEVAVQDEFPHPEFAKYPVNLITVYDTFEKTYHTFAYGHAVKRIADDCETDWSKVNLHICKSEVELFDHWIEWMASDHPDVIAGFNSRSFDIPYLVNRGQKIVGERIQEISPLGVLKNRKLNDRKTGREFQSFDIAGITHLDYLPLYRDKFSYKNLVNFKLNTVCEEELGAQKLEYDGTYKEFWMNDFQLYVEYNIRDVELLVKLEEKLQYVQLVRQICNMGLVEYEAIYSSIPYVLNSVVVSERRETGKIFPSPQNINYDEVDDDFPGAYVMDPQIGRYEAAMSFDLNSLYPSIMIANNICPSTKFAKITYRSEDGQSMILKLTSGKTKEITKAQLDKILKESCTLSSYDVLFMKPDIKKGCIPKFLEGLYATRRSAKDTMLELEYEISQIKVAIKNETDVAALKTLNDKMAITQVNAQRFGTKQLVLKIVLNTMYGIMGTKYSAIFDKDLAGSITLTGQTIIKDSIRFVDTYFKKIYKFDGNAVVYGDTDSMYVNVKAMADSVLGVGADVNDMENIAKLCKEGDKFSDIVNTFCFEKVVKEKMHSDMDWIKFKRESFSSGAMFFKKKRYIMRVRDDEGVPVDKFKYVGVQLKRQELPPLVKDKLKEFVEQSFLELWDNTRAQKEMHKLFEWFNNLSVSEISCVSGINSWKDSDGFLRAAKGSGMHLRGAIYHNDLIHKFKLAEKYDIIQPGAKVRYVLIKPNPYKGVNVISFLNEFPKEFEEFLYPDIDKMFKKTVTAPLEHIFSVSGWTPFDKDFDEDFLSI